MVKPSPDLIGRTIKLIREQRIILDGDRVLLACSGGIDSATLLFVLNEIRRKINFDIGIAHVNHQLRRGESDRDEAFVRDTAKGYGLPFFLKKADVKEYAASHGLSLQHAGRDIRYLFLNEVADNEGFTRIAMAHNLDDQIETFLLRLIKGTGLRGLSSIPPVRDRIIRPFLGTYRSEIASFAEQNSIAFVEDSSNQRTVYERNYIRHRIVPLIEELNPAFRDRAASLLQDIKGINAIFDREKDTFMRLTRVEKDQITLPLGDFGKLDSEVRYRALADIFARLEPSFVPLREHVRLIEKIVLAGRPNLTIDLPSGLKAKKVYDRLVFTTRPARGTIPETSELHFGSNHILRFGIDIDMKILKKAPRSFPGDPLIAYFDADTCKDLSIRTFRPGDRIHPLGMVQPLKLKDFFISRKVPLEDRRHIPLLLSGNEIIWIIGHRIDERYKLTQSTHNILKVTVKKTCQPPSDYD